MSTTVDRRIVDMQFNNQQFESGIKTSMNSLDKFEKALKLDGVTNGFKGLGNIVRSFTLDPVANAAQTVAYKFDALRVMGVTALMNITNSAVNAGKRIASAFTIDPIKTGFQEYETQINAVQTILANTKSKGTTIDDVNAALDQLNAYADKTIYNFTEMTRNIGTFTAAGVDLDTATNAIQGIANLAAVSGSNSQQASTAMYQLSQALSSGTVKLQDWNSVVNAGMGGQVFQDALKETARVHGISIDDMIKKQGSFRETLSKGWLTSDILTETLEKFTATTEGLTEAQIESNREMWKSRGYTDEQIDAIFDLGATATDAATKVKTFTQLFDTLKEAAQSGWTQSWEILIGDFEEAKELLTQISNEIGSIIGASADARNTLLQGWKDAGGRDDLISGFKNLYVAISAIIDPAKKAFDEIFPPITVKNLKDFTQAFEDVTAKLKPTPETADKIKRSFKGLFAVFDILKQALGAVTSRFGKLLGVAAPIGSNFLDMTASLGDFLVTLSGTVRESGVFSGAMDLIGSAVEFVGNGFKKLTERGSELFEKLSSVDMSGIEVKFEPLKSLADAWTWIIDKLTGAWNKLQPILIMAGSYISSAFGEASDAISGFVQNGGLESINKVLGGGLIGSLIVGVTKIANSFSNIGKNAGGFLENLSKTFGTITGSLEQMQNKLKTEAIKNIAISIGILAASLMVLSLVDSNNLGNAIAAITTMFIELIAALKGLEESMKGSETKGLTKMVGQLIGFSVAILILSGAMAVLASIDQNGIVQSLIAIMTLMGMLTLVAQKLSSNEGGLIKGAGSLIAFAMGIGILALAVKSLGSMDLASIGKGLLALGGILAELALFTKVYDFSSIGISAGLGLMAMATALLILSGAIAIMGSMDLGVICKGLLVMASALVALVITAEALPTAGMIQAGVGLMAMATSLVIMAGAIAIMGNLGIGTIVTGLITMASALTILVIAANTMKGSIGGAAAMLIMAAALVVLGAALHIIGSLSIGEAVTALVTLAAALAIIGVAATLLAPVIPAMLGLAAAVLLLSVAVGAGGIALTAFGAGLTAVGVGLSALVTGIVGAIITIISSITVIAEDIGTAIVAIADAINAAAPAVGEAINTIVNTIINVFVNAVNSLAGAIIQVGPSLLVLAGYLMALGVASALLAPLAPAIIATSAALAAFGIGCAAIAAGVLVLAGALELLGLAGLTVAASLTDIYDTINDMGDLSLDAVISCAKLFRSAGKKAAEMILEGFNEGFTNAGAEISRAMLTAMNTAKFAELGTLVVTNFMSGIQSTGDKPVSGIKLIVSNIITAVKSYDNSFYSIGSDIVSGLVNGINSNRYRAINAAASLGNATKQAMQSSVDAHSPSRDFEDIGMWCDMGLANGLIKFSGLAVNAAKNLGNSAIQPIRTMASGALSELGSMSSALRGTAALASGLDSSITSEQYVTVNHTFDDLTVKGVNNRDEFIAVANYSVEDMLTDLMRKGIRR